MTLTPVSVQLRNAANGARSQVVTHGIRLAPGELTTGARNTALRVTDGSTVSRVQWEPFGEIYPGSATESASFSQIAVHYPASMTSLEAREVTISEGSSQNVPFQLTPAVTNNVSTTVIALTIQGETRTIRASDVLGTTLDQNANADGRIGAEANAHLRRHVWRERWSNVSHQQLRAIWWEVAIEFLSGHDTAKIFVTWGYSWAEAGQALGNPWNDVDLILTSPVILTITGARSWFHREDKKINNISRSGNQAVYRLVDPCLAVTVVSAAAGTAGAGSFTFSTPVTIEAGTQFYVKADGLATRENYGLKTVAVSVVSGTTVTVTDEVWVETAITTPAFVPCRGTGTAAALALFEHRLMPQGCSHMLAGELGFASQTIPTTNGQRDGILAMAMNWPTVGLPPFHVIPDYNATVTDRANAITRLEEYETWLYGQGRDADPWYWGGALNVANQGGGGAQGLAFGTMRWWLLLRTCYPSCIGALLADMRQELGRPINNRRPTLSADLWSYAEHPQLAIWDGVPILDSATDDILGASEHIADWHCPITSNSPVYGWNRQHASFLTEVVVALVTADYSALKFFEVHEQIWLGSTDVNSPNITVAGNEVGRAFGRGMIRCGMDVFAVTGTPAVFDYLVARVLSVMGLGRQGFQVAYQHCPGRPGITYANWMHSMGSYDDRDAEVQAGSLEQHPHGYPWMDSVCSIFGYGLSLLLSRRLGDAHQATQACKLFAADLALQTTMYGWLDLRGLAPDAYYGLTINKTQAEVSIGTNWALLVGKTVTGYNSNTGVVVGLIETGGGNATLWLKNCTGPLWNTGTQALTFAASTFTASGLGEVTGFVGIKARRNTQSIYHPELGNTFTPLTTAQIETASTFPGYQPKTGEQPYILACTKEADPIITTGDGDDDNFLSAGMLLRISGQPAGAGGWTVLNGDWVLGTCTKTTVQLLGVDTSACTGNYVQTGAVLLNRMLWWNESVKPYTAYSLWQLGSAVVAEIFAAQGVYGSKSPDVQTKARTIIDYYGTLRAFDAGGQDVPRWNDIDEHAAIRANVFGVDTNPPSAPVNLRASATSGTEARATWQNTAANATFVDVEYRRTTGGAWSSTSVAATSSSAIITGLTADSAYEVRAKARNANGSSAYVGPTANSTFTTRSVSPGKIAPDAPTTLVTDSPNGSSITVAWTIEADNHDGHEVQWRVSPSGAWSAALVLGATAAYQIFQLASNTTYNIRVRAYHDQGVSEWLTGNQITDTEPPQGSVPPPPRPVSAVGGTRQIVLTWEQDLADPVVEIFEVSTVNDTGELVWVANVTAPTVTYTHAGLGWDELKVYQLRARNDLGYSEYSTPIIGRTVVEPPGGGAVAPSAPSNLRATNVGVSKVDLEWTAASGTEVGYIIERYISDELRPSGDPVAALDEPFVPHWKEIGRTLDPIVTFTDLGPLASDTDYSYRVSAYNTGGTSDPCTPLMVHTAIRVSGPMTRRARRNAWNRRRPLIVLDWETITNWRLGL